MSAGGRRWALRAALVLHVVLAWVVVLHAWRQPIPENWDVVPYAALVLRQPGMPAAELSQRAYADVRSYVGDAGFQVLVDGGPGFRDYRGVVHAKPEALVDTLGLYSIKPLYVAAARALYPLTGNAASAAVLASAAALGLLLALLPIFAPRPLPAIAALWLLLFTGAPPILMIASCATPDSLAMLFVAACVVAALRRASPMLIGWLALAGVLTRPDAAFLLVPLLTGLVWNARADRRRAAVLLGGAAVAFAMFVVLGRQALPWSTLFWHSFVVRQPFPSLGTHAITVTDYLAVAGRTYVTLLAPRPLLFLLAAAALAIVPWLRTRRIEPFQWVAAAAIGNILVHYLVFPADEFGHERLFLGSYVAVLLALLHAWAARPLRVSPGTG